MLAEFPSDGSIKFDQIQLNTIFMPGVASCRHFHGSSLVLRLHRLVLMLGVWYKKMLSESYAIHDNVMI